MRRIFFNVILAVIVVFEFGDEGMGYSILHSFSPMVMIKSRGRSNDLKTFRTVIFATYDGLDIGLICGWMYASRL